ncbi:MAG: GTPase [Thalassobium sp.]|nr:MAG: GTPase [Thalassobium sp.]
MSVNESVYLSSLATFEQLIARNDDLIDASIRNELNTEGFSSRAEAVKHLESLKQDGRSLKIGVIGRVKAGKSSLINALLFDGEEVLPKAATPMTAALTSIGYAESFTAEVHFFSAEDIRQLQDKSQEFEREVARLFEQYKSAYAERQMRNPMRPLPPLDENQLRKKVTREVSENGVLAAAADICQRMKSSDVDVHKLGDSRILTADSIQALNKELMEYVGAAGKYMPYTRELVLGMPVPSLQGIEVIDTPGVNDPVKSREQRTYERLKECNAAFIVSPAGQFLSQQDFELADRLSAREGTQEIYLVASQADMQLHTNLRDDAKGDFHLVMDKLHQILTNQARSALNGANNDVLSRIGNEISDRLIITSGICETILKSGDAADEGAIHAMKLLKENYRDYFSAEDATEVNLKRLSARDRLQAAVDTVRLKKEQILQQQAQNFIDAQWQTFLQVKERVLAAVMTRRDTVENGDLGKLRDEIDHLKRVSGNAIAAVNSEFLNQAEELRLKLPLTLDRVIEQAIVKLDEESEKSEGEAQETYRVEKDGIGSWLARKLWGGGSEERSRTVATLQPKPIRQVLEKLAKLMKTGMKDCTSLELLHWRKELTTSVSRQLRATIGDDGVDINRLQSVCRSVIAKLVDFPEVDIPQLPAELAKSNIIKGSAVGEYLDAAQDYSSELEKSGQGFIQSVRISIDSIMAKNVGEELLSDLLKEVEDLQDKVENKALTLEKMARMEADLRVV